MFEETSCISAIEAGAAGCQMVTSNYGALYETCAQWATFVPYQPNRKQMANEYARVLDHAIDNYWSPANQKKLAAQVEYYNQFWTWDYRMTEWREFFDRISK
jgi:glycosyltransferase involved in cell wall biosynthesis